MNTRYFIQVPGEESPRGPLPAAAVRRLFEAGTITGGDAMCQEGDADWLTLDDYYEQIMPPRPAPAAYHPAMSLHPALAAQRSVSTGRMVFGVICYILAFCAIGGSLLGFMEGNLLLGACGAIMVFLWLLAGRKLTAKE
jgi:hypothetical protein